MGEAAYACSCAGDVLRRRAYKRELWAKALHRGTRFEEPAFCAQLEMTLVARPATDANRT